MDKLVAGETNDMQISEHNESNWVLHMSKGL